MPLGFWGWSVLPFLHEPPPSSAYLGIFPVTSLLCYHISWYITELFVLPLFLVFGKRRCMHLVLQSFWCSVKQMYDGQCWMPLWLSRTARASQWPLSFSAVGDKKYMMGPKLSTLDATVFGHLARQCGPYLGQDLNGWLKVSWSISLCTVRG